MADPSSLLRPQSPECRRLKWCHGTLESCPRDHNDTRSGKDIWKSRRGAAEVRLWIPVADKTQAGAANQQV